MVLGISADKFPVCVRLGLFDPVKRHGQTVHENNMHDATGETPALQTRFQNNEETMKWVTRI